MSQRDRSKDKYRNKQAFTRAECSPGLCDQRGRLAWDGLGPRVRLLIHLLEPFDTCVRVDLRRRDGRVAEELLDGAEIGAGVEEMGGESVAERVRGESGAFVNQVQKGHHRVLDRAHGHPLAAVAEKKRSAVGAGPDRAEQLVALRFVVAQRERGVIAEGGDALLPPLAADFHLLGEEVDVGAVDSAQFGEAHPGRVEELEDRRVSDVGEFTFACARSRNLTEEIHLRTVEVAGEILLELRRRDGPRGVGVYLLVAMQKPIKAADRAQSSRHRALAQRFLRQVSEEASDGEAVESLPGPGGRTVVGREIRHELVQIARVGLQRIRAYVAFFLEMEKKVLDFLVSLDRFG